MPESDLALLTRAAEAAGRIAMHYWKQAPQVWEKADDQGPVTEADLAANLAIRDILRPARPDHGWLSEEDAADPDRCAARRIFIVDPIDGTRAFIAGEEGFSHSLAIAEAGRITAAVVHLPARKLTYTATADGPALLNGAPIHATARTEAEGAHVLTGSASLQPAHWPGGVPTLRRAFRTSMAWRLCLVAEGRYDATLTLRDSWEWDIAAGALIAEAAGARVSDRAGAALAFNAPRPLSPGLIAAPPALHADLLHRLTAAG